MVARYLFMLALALALPADSQAQSQITLNLSPAQAAALQDAMDFRARSVLGTSPEFWQAEMQIGEALRATDVRSEHDYGQAYSRMVAASQKRSGR